MNAMHKCVQQVCVWKNCCCASISVPMLLSHSLPYQPLNTFLQTNAWAVCVCVCLFVCLAMPEWAHNIVCEYVCVCQRDSETEGDRVTEKEKEREKKDNGIQCSLSLGPSPLGVTDKFHCVNLCVITESQRKQKSSLSLFTSQKASGQLVSLSDYRMCVCVYVHTHTCMPEFIFIFF